MINMTFLDKLTKKAKSSEKWPSQNEHIELMFTAKRQSDKFIVYSYDDGPDVSQEAIGKAASQVSSENIFLAVDLSNKVIFLSSNVIGFMIDQGFESEILEMGFQKLFHSLQDQGIPVRLIRIKKSGSVNYLE